MNADALSRLPMQEFQEENKELPEYGLTLQTLDKTLVSSQTLRRMTQEDEVLSLVKDYVLQEWPRQRTNRPDLAPFIARQLELSLDQGLLY